MKYVATLLALAVLAFSPLPNSGIAFAKDCPPGLAKKNPPCVPPGQARQAVTPEVWPGRYRVGNVLDRGDVVYLDDFARYDLRPLPYGQRYAVIDDRIVVIDTQSYQILQFLQAFTALMD